MTKTYCDVETSQVGKIDLVLDSSRMSGTYRQEAFGESGDCNRSYRQCGLEKEMGVYVL